MQGWRRSTHACRRWVAPCVAPSAPVLRYGQQAESSGFLCTSQHTGIITCVLAAGRHKGTGFRVSADAAVRIG